MSKTIWIINQSATTPDVGKGSRHYYFARELEKLGYEVYLVAASYFHKQRRSPVVRNAFQMERREGVNIVWVKVSRYGQARSKKRIWNWFVFAWKLPQLRKFMPEPPDAIIYSSPSLVGYLGAEKLARKSGATLAFEVRDIWPLTLCHIGGYLAGHPFIRFLQWIEDRAYRNASVVISNLKSSHDHMVKHGLDKAKFHWIPNGISLEEVSKPQPLDQQVGDQLPKSGFVVGYAGSVGRANCLGTLVEAATLLRDVDDVTFVIVGNGEDKRHLEQSVKRAQINNVVFIDAIAKPQIQSTLQHFSVLFIGLADSPVFKYGVSPNKLFDYLYAGRPILYAVDSGDYRPISHAKAGLEVPAEDSEAIANAVLELYKMPVEKRREMGANGHRLAVEEYDYRVLAGQLAEALFGSDVEESLGA